MSLNPNPTIFVEIVSKVEEFLSKTKKDEIVIVIDGYCGAAKTSLAEYMANKLNGRVINGDDFALPMETEVTNPERWNEVGGNIDYIRMEKDAISKLKEDMDYEYFVPRHQKIMGRKHLPYKKLNIFEGSYVMHPHFGKYYDYSIFLKVDSEIRKKRILDRVGEEIYKSFVSHWIPREQRYFKECDIEKKCDLVYYTDEL